MAGVTVATLAENHSTTADLYNDETRNVVFREFQLWNQIPATILLLIVMVFGSVANIFIIYCIYKKKIGIKYVNPVLLAIAAKNMVAISTCIPLAMAMLLSPHIIFRRTCDVQENMTFLIVFAGYLYPALLSVVQCYHVVKPHSQLLTEKKLFFAVCLVSLISLLLGLQAELLQDEHGCHLWSIRTDEVVMAYIYSIVSVFIFTLITVITSYAVIYFHARAASNLVKTAKKNNSVSRTGDGGSNVSQTDKSKVKARERIENERRMTTAILKPMFCIVFSNLMTSLPWIILYSFTVFDNIDNTLKYAELRVLTICIMYLPIATDPIIFLGFSTKGKVAVMAVLKRRGPTVVPAADRPTMSVAPQRLNGSRVSPV